MNWWDLDHILIAFAVMAVAYFFSWVLCRAAAMGDEEQDKYAERLRMSQQDWRWPER